jgi:PAS domain S-box-containing protein
MKHARILVVEDEGIVAEQLQGSLTRMGYDTLPPVASGEEALNVAQEAKPDLVLMDMQLLGELNGVQTAGQIRQMADIPVVFLTAYADDEVLRQIQTVEPYGYLVKPVQERELHATIEVALSRRMVDDRLEDAVRERTKELATMNQELLRDIEERKVAEKALQESEWRFRRVSDFMLDMVSVVNNASDMILIVTPEGVIRYGTPSIEQHLQFEPPNFLGKNLREFLCPEERDEVAKAIVDVVATHVTKVLTHYLRKRDGSTVYVESIIKFYVDHLNVNCALITARDITEHKKADDALRAALDNLESRVRERTAQLADANDALRASEERYRRITDAVTDYIYTVEMADGTPCHTTHRASCVKITGYTVDEFESNPYLWLQMVHPDDRAIVAQHAAHMLSGHDEPPIKHRIIRKDGSVGWVLNTVVPHRNENGVLLSYDGVINEISE